MANLSKKGQLLGIEIHYFLLGFAVGFGGGLALVFMGVRKIIPFQIPAVCGFLMNSKKAQLEVLEGKEFIFGFIVGIIASFVLTYLGTNKIIPFSIPLVCDVPK